MAINPRMGTVRQDWRSFKGFSDAYSAAAQDILATLNAASTTSATITNHAADLDALLLNAIGFSHSGIDLLAPNKDNLVNAINGLEPTTNLLMKYNPEYTCMILSARSGIWTTAGTRRSAATAELCWWTPALLLGDDPYSTADNLPIVAAKGGPGGKPGCGSLPDASKNFPVRAFGHQHRLGHRCGYPAEPRYRPSLLGQLPADYPGGARIAERAGCDCETGPWEGRHQDQFPIQERPRTAHRYTGLAEHRCGRACHRHRRRNRHRHHPSPSAATTVTTE